MSNIEITPEGWSVLDDDHLSCSQDVRKQGRIDYDVFGSIDICRSYFKEGSTIIDVGAHIGCWTVPMVQAVGVDGLVYAFEADPEPYACLQANVNRVGTAHLINAAVWRESGQVQFLRNVSNRGCSSIRFGEGEAAPNIEFTVHSVALDDMNFRDVSFIKIDIEGSEMDCLLGSSALLESQHPVLFFETIGSHNYGYDLENIYTWLRERDYTLTLYPIGSPDVHDVLCI
jgi:FkbM family methyltransferase